LVVASFVKPFSGGKGDLSTTVRKGDFRGVTTEEEFLARLPDGATLKERNPPKKRSRA